MNHRHAEPDCAPNRRRRQQQQRLRRHRERPAGRGGRALDEKQIIKEGLSEYFIYTIEGTETIPNGWSKQLRSFVE